MGLSSLIHNVVKIADTVTKDLQAEIDHHEFKSRDGYGKPTYYDDEGPTVRRVVVSHKQQKLFRDDGTEIISHMKILIVGKVAVGMHDKIVFPDGSTPPIINVKSMLDKDGNPYAVEVFF